MWLRKLKQKKEIIHIKYLAEYLDKNNFINIKEIEELTMEKVD